MTNPLKMFNKLIALIDIITYSIYIIKSVIFKKYEIDNIYNISYKLHKNNEDDIDVNLLVKLSDITEYIAYSISKLRIKNTQLQFTIISGGAFLNKDNTSIQVFSNDFTIGKEVYVTVPLLVTRNYSISVDRESFIVKSLKIEKLT